MKSRISPVLFLFIISILCTGCSKVNIQSNKIESSEVQISEMEESIAQAESVSEVQAGTNGTNRIQIMELENYTDALFTTVEQFSLVNLNPCILSEGKAYVLEGEEWIQLDSQDMLTEVYKGEEFNALTDNGKLVVENLLDEDTYGAYALGSAALYYNAEKIMEISADNPVKTIGSGIYDGYVLCWFENGELELIYNGEEIPIKGLEGIKQISGTYILTDDGTVYSVLLYEASQKVDIQKVSDAKITYISACNSAGRCIGIKEDGSVEIWSDIHEEMATDFRDAVKAEMGFVYCIAMDKDGEILFSSYDKEIEKAINDYFKADKKRALDISCLYQRIAVLYEDLSITMIDME